MLDWHYFDQRRSFVRSTLVCRRDLATMLPGFVQHGMRRPVCWSAALDTWRPINGSLKINKFSYIFSFILTEICSKYLLRNKFLSWKFVNLYLVEFCIIHTFFLKYLIGFLVQRVYKSTKKSWMSLIKKTLKISIRRRSCVTRTRRKRPIVYFLLSNRLKNF